MHAFLYVFEAFLKSFKALRNRSLDQSRNIVELSRKVGLIFLEKLFLLDQRFNVAQSLFGLNERSTLCDCAFDDSLTVLCKLFLKIVDLDRKGLPHVPLNLHEVFQLHLVLSMDQSIMVSYFLALLLPSLNEIDGVFQLVELLFDLDVDSFEVG